MADIPPPAAPPLDKALLNQLLDFFDGPFSSANVGERTKCSSMLLHEATAIGGPVEVHGWLRSLAAELAKGTTAEALALALVYEVELCVTHNRDAADALHHFDEMRPRLLREVEAWDTFVRHARHFQRVKDWAASRPKPPPKCGRTRRAKP